MESGSYHGMGEMLVYHAAKKGRFLSVSEYRQSIDGPVVRDSLALAKRQGWPYVVHIEYHALSPGDQARYRNELTTFLINNRDVAVLLIHLAQLKTDEAEPLLEAHPNLYLMTSHCNPAFLYYYLILTREALGIIHHERIEEIYRISSKKRCLPEH